MSTDPHAERLTLLKSDNAAGYFGVSHSQPGQPMPYQARVRRGGKQVYLGRFATAKEAALCVAQSPEGQAAAKQAVAAPPLTSEEARQQAEAEGLTLLKADSKTGYYGVNVANPGQPKSYVAQVWRGGKQSYLGNFATAEEAALCVARSPEGRAAAKRPAAPPLLTSEEARQQARAAAKRPAAAASLTSEAVGRRGARSLRRKELPGRREQVLTAPGARSAEEEAEVGAQEQAEEEEAEEAEEEADVVVLDATVVVEEEAAAEEAEDVQTAVVEMVDVVQVMEHEDVVDEGGRSEGQPKRHM